MEKTITIDPNSGSVTVEQHEVHEGVGVSSNGFKINTGMGWGIDIAIVIAALALVYIGKKYVDLWFAKKKGN
jgi:hypothetical protein